MTLNPITRYSKFVMLNAALIGAAVGIFLTRASVLGMLAGISVGAGIAGAVIRSQKKLEASS